MTALLTIAIPTYNRAAHLRFLLETLFVELAGRDDVAVLVSDNASTDDTADVTAAMAGLPTARVVRNAVNIGADGNIAQVFELAETDYVWIMGDDDLPTPGTVAAILSLLRRNEPDLVAMRSRWVADVRTDPAPQAAEAEDYELVDATTFARRINVWMTFLSGIIVSKARFSASCPPAEIRRHMGTNLVQLGWVLNVLAAGQCFAIVESPWVMATGGNSGGYAVMQTFAVDLPRVSEAVLGSGSPLARAIVSRTCVGYLPQLVWNVRFVHTARFTPENSWQTLRAELSRHASYWLLLRPIAEAPRPVAAAALYISRAVAAAQRRFDRFR